jgi:hypothetical protein
MPDLEDHGTGAPAGPGFASVRAPVNIWFVPALGLALLAAAGLAAAAERWRQAWLCPLVLAVFGTRGRLTSNSMDKMRICSAAQLLDSFPP